MLARVRARGGALAGAGGSRDAGGAARRGPAETAYAYELRGPRRLQARENLKKLRGLVRRIQNRGYATLARIAEHLDRLAVGDESNAAIDAVDAVSLMTVHAAKGLEFPDRVRRQHGTGHRRRAGADSRRRRRAPTSRRWRSPTYQSESRRGRAGARARGNQAPAVRRADARARSAVPVGDGQERRVPDGPRQPRRSAAAVARGAVRRGPRATRRSWTAASGRALTRRASASQAWSSGLRSSATGVPCRQPSSGRRASASLWFGPTRITDSSGFPPAVAADPCNPVWAARFAMYLV